MPFPEQCAFSAIDVIGHRDSHWSFLRIRATTSTSGFAPSAISFGASALFDMHRMLTEALQGIRAVWANEKLHSSAVICNQGERRIDGFSWIEYVISGNWANSCSLARRPRRWSIFSLHLHVHTLVCQTCIATCFSSTAALQHVPRGRFRHVTM